MKIRKWLNHTLDANLTLMDHYESRDDDLFAYYSGKVRGYGYALYCYEFDAQPIDTITAALKEYQEDFDTAASIYDEQFAKGVLDALKDAATKVKRR